MQPELERALVGRRFGKVLRLSRFEFVFDLRFDDARYLFVSIEPASPRIYLIRRRFRDLEKLGGNPSPFILTLKRRLANAEFAAVHLADGERVFLVEISAIDEMGVNAAYTLLVQLTGRSANLFLLDADGRILESERESEGDRQNVGDIYSPPERPETSSSNQKVERADDQLPAGVDLSERLDKFYVDRENERRFTSLAGAARSKLARDLAKSKKLESNLKRDLAGHGEAEHWKKHGDLLLANISTAKRGDGIVRVVDYFDEGVPVVEISVDNNDSLTEAAEKYFRQYTKARNAATEIEKRLIAVRKEIDSLETRQEGMELAIDARDEELLSRIVDPKRKLPTEIARGKPSETSSVARSFISSDGFEILVGKKAKDNDFLTFRLAKSLDTWMHAADYPGSHVVIRNPNRREMPPQTLLEAAQLAAFYSRGNKQPKAAVHYTQKKFVNKPKGAAPGLVSLASFKTLLVEPNVPDSVTKH